MIDLVKNSIKILVFLAALALVLGFIGTFIKGCHYASERVVSLPDYVREKAKEDKFKALRIYITEECDSQKLMKEKILKRDNFRDHTGRLWTWCGYRYFDMTNVLDFAEWSTCIKANDIPPHVKYALDNRISTICEVGWGKIKMIQPDIKNYVFGLVE